MIDYTTLLNQYVLDTENSELNYQLGLYYFSIDQTASAVSFFIRTAERTDDDLQKYKCLLLASKCFEKQGMRAFSVKGLIQHALALLPKRPEAYYLLSKYYEYENKDGNWFNCYMISSIGLVNSDFNLPPLDINLNYPGEYGILFQKALSSWWCGLCEEAIALFKNLLKNYTMDEQHRVAALNNLTYFKSLTKTELTLYNKEKFSQLKLKFNKSDIIEQNFSEAYQDMFVLSMLNGKENGTYLEIGAGNTFYGNNTALLEQSFNWSGVSIDIDEKFVNAYANERKNLCILKDATLIDYHKFLSGLNFPKNIDYLQIDCDPPDVSFKVLTSMPFETYKFAVITYEHDFYCDQTKMYREKSRNFLKSFGYVMVVGNIAPDEWRNYEDWWIHPDLIDVEILNKMLLLTDETKSAESYMLITQE